MTVVLTKKEMFKAAQVGARRHIEAVLRRLPDRHGLRKSDGNGWQLHIEGACGEMAAAKALGLAWDAPVNTFKAGGDVAALQVRTRSRHDYDLIVRDDDRDDDVFILVTGQAPNYEVRGWILGRDAKKARFRQTHGGREAAYFVPGGELRPLDELADKQKAA